MLKDAYPYYLANKPVQPQVIIYNFGIDADYAFFAQEYCHTVFPSCVFTQKPVYFL